MTQVVANPYTDAASRPKLSLRCEQASSLVQLEAPADEVVITHQIEVPPQ